MWTLSQQDMQLEVSGKLLKRQVGLTLDTIGRDNIDMIDRMGKNIETVRGLKSETNFRARKHYKCKQDWPVCVGCHTCNKTSAVKNFFPNILTTYSIRGVISGLVFEMTYPS